MTFHPDTTTTTWASPLGEVIIAASPLGLCGVWFHDQKHLPEWKIWPWSPDLLTPMLSKTKRWLSTYFDGKGASAMPELDLSGGTVFQQAVWRALLAIPSGATQSYGALAAGLGAPNAARAVGAAVGKNPISIIVPCHRVMGASGALTGYAGGVVRKQRLLEIEGVALGSNVQAVLL